jgi:cytochrome c556
LNPEEEYTVNIWSKATLSAAALLIGASLAHAAADDTIKARQACMKTQGGFMGVAVPIVKGEKPYDAEAIKAAFGGIDAACADWANFWGEDTMKGETVETFAKPEIWSDKAGFEKVSGEAYAAGQALRAATDEASFKAAFGAFGAGCKGCHDGFRRPKP